LLLSGAIVVLQLKDKTEAGQAERERQRPQRLEER